MEVAVKAAPSEAEAPAQALPSATPDAVVAQPAPVMDIRPPQTGVAPAPADPSKADDGTQPEKTKDKKEEKPAKVIVPKKPRQPGGIGMAIAATVVIVVVLAAMAVYAYLKTQ